MPDGTKVFQLPIVAFPEEPPYGSMLDYDLLRPFLQSDGSTDWSYGKVKGRPERRLAVDEGARHRRHPRGAPGARRARVPRPVRSTSTATSTRARSCRRRCGEELGVDPIVSPNGRMLFYDMRPYVDGLDQTPEELETGEEQLAWRPRADAELRHSDGVLEAHTAAARERQS